VTKVSDAAENVLHEMNHILAIRSVDDYVPTLDDNLWAMSVGERATASRHASMACGNGCHPTTCFFQNDRASDIGASIVGDYARRARTGSTQRLRFGYRRIFGRYSSRNAVAPRLFRVPSPESKKIT
jgi:hypothetical protein